MNNHHLIKNFNKYVRQSILLNYPNKYSNNKISKWLTLSQNSKVKQIVLHLSNGSAIVNNDVILNTLFNNNFMSVYSGFATRAQESKYNGLV